MNKTVSLLASLCIITGASGASAYYNSGAAYPTGPNPQLTPGSLCTTPDRTRYPEHIAYCERDVDPMTKKAIIQTYDRQLGFHIGQMDRGDFKIDHYIPLCAGGSNNVNNLWPQHKSVYEITDPLEYIACQKMSEGAISQKDAITLIRAGKADLSKVNDIINHLEHL